MSLGWDKVGAPFACFDEMMEWNFGLSVEFSNRFDLEFVDYFFNTFRRVALAMFNMLLGRFYNLPFVRVFFFLSLTRVLQVCTHINGSIILAIVVAVDAIHTHTNTPPESGTDNQITTTISALALSGVTFQKGVTFEILSNCERLH